MDTELSGTTTVQSSSGRSTGQPTKVNSLDHVFELLDKKIDMKMGFDKTMAEQ